MSRSRFGGIPDAGGPRPVAVTAEDHLSLATLLELVDGELAPAEAEQAREHLKRCPDCLARSRSLLELPDPPAADDIGAGPEARDTAWRELGRLLPLHRLEAERRETRRTHVRFWLAAAAALIVGAAAGFWLAPRSGPPSGLTAAASTQLLPQDFAVLGTLPAPPAVACPPPGGAFVFVLGGLDGSGGAGSAYRVELTDAALGTRLEIATTTNRFGEIELTLDRSALADGAYRILAKKPSEGDDAGKEYRLILDCP